MKNGSRFKSFLLLLLLIQPTANAWQWSDITHYWAQLWKQNRTDLIITIGALIVGVAAYFNLKSSKNKSNTANFKHQPKINLEAKKQIIRDALKNEEQQVLQEFCSNKKIRFEKLKSLIESQKLRDAMNQSLKEATDKIEKENHVIFSQEFLSLVEQVKQECPIKLNFKIFALEKNCWFACGLYNVIFIVESEFNKDHHNKSEKKWTLMHEIYHIENQDVYYTFCLNNIAHLGDLPNAWERRWNHFKEKRADICAALVNKEYAQASVSYFERRCCNNPKNQFIDSDSHPSDATRLKYCQEVLKIYS
jgi:hypothetical protein